MTATDTLIRYESDGAVATITLARPQKLNAITRSMHDDLLEAVRRFDADPHAYVLVLRADGRSFCAGRDIAEQAVSRASPTADMDPTITQYGLPPTSKIVITAAQGHALGAGGYFFLAGDVRIAGRSLRFGLREVPTGVLGPYWLAAAEGVSRALAFRVAIGEDLSVDELERAGLVTEVVDDDELGDATQRWVERLLARPRRHLLATKALAAQTAPFQYTPVMRAAEYHARVELDRLSDTSEAARAFVEGRQPNFTGD